MYNRHYDGVGGWIGMHLDGQAHSRSTVDWLLNGFWHAFLKSISIPGIYLAFPNQMYQYWSCVPSLDGLEYQYLQMTVLRTRCVQVIAWESKVEDHVHVRGSKVMAYSRPHTCLLLNVLPQLFDG